MATHSISWPGESLGQRSLAGYGPQGRKETRLKLLHTHTRMHTHLEEQERMMIKKEENKSIFTMLSL